MPRLKIPSSRSGCCRAACASVTSSRPARRTTTGWISIPSPTVSSAPGKWRSSSIGSIRDWTTILKVEWIADFVEPAKALVERPDVLRHLESFDRQTDTLLRSLAGALEELMALDRRPGSSASVSLSADRLRAALNNVLRLVFDVERTRGKLQEWFSTVDDPVKVRTAQTLASVIRKIEFLSGDHPVALQGLVAPFDSRAVAGLSGRLAEIPGLSVRMTSHRSVPARVRRRVRRLISVPAILSRLVAADRFIESRLQSVTRASWLTNYRRVRSRIRRGLL